MDKFKLLYVIIISFTLALLMFLFLTQLLNPHQILFGAYDPNRTVISQPGLSIEEAFFQWNADPKTIVASVSQMKSDNRTPLITLEPWASTTLPASDNLLLDIRNGKYDPTIKGICSSLSVFQEPILIRWGHEMELTNSRYPWAGKNPTDYILAYQHFVTTCKQTNANIKFIWSPSGESNLSQYWPGASYVDYIGLSIYSFGQWDIKNIGHQRTFLEVFNPKYARVKNYNKPIIISEIGVTGTPAFQVKWFKDAIGIAKKNNSVYAMVFFSSLDTPGGWGPGYATPDWRLTIDQLNQIIGIPKNN